MRRLFLLPMVALFAGAAIAANSAAPRDGEGATSAEMSEQQQALRDARRRAEKARERSERLERQAEIALEDAERTAVERAALGARVDEAEAELEGARARVLLVARRQKLLTGELEEQRRPLMRLAAALQVMARRPPELVLAQPRTVSELAHIRLIFNAVLPEIRRRTAELRSAVDRSAEMRAQAELAVDSMNAAKAKLQERRTALAAVEARFRSVAGERGREAALERERAIGLGETARDIIDRMRIERDEERVEASLRRLAGPLVIESREGGRVAASRNVYMLPVEGEVRAGLGELSDNGVRARGITIDAVANAPIVAPAGGKVLFAAPYRSYGAIVIIQHGQGWISLVTGAESLSVAKGDSIVRGERIGTTGNDGGEVMVELRRKGRPMDIGAIL